MIKYRKDYKYVCSTEGTEQILPTNESNVTSLSPVVDITYGEDGELLENLHFTYRQTAGGEISDIPENVATVQAIRGQSVVWNQYISSPTYVNRSTDTRNQFLFFIQYQRGGRPYVARNVGFDLAATNFCLNGILSIESDFSGGSIIYKHNGSSVDLTFITQQNGVALHKIYYSFYVNTCDVSTVGGLSIKNIKLIDLTLMFGAGNEPETVEEFEAWLAANVGLRDYYPYDAGTILNVKSTGIKTTGFNQWDEEWALGGIYPGGAEDGNTTRIKTKNYIPVFGNTDYYICFLNYTDTLGTVIYYNGNKEAIGRAMPSLGRLITTPENASFMKVSFYPNYGTTYNHDICINISDPNKNGTYEPYFGSTLPMEVTTMTGKLNGAGQSVTIFPNGMNRVGNVYDEVYVDNGVLKAVKRLGVVDMGTIAWSLLNDGRGYLSISIQNILVKDGAKVNVLCSKYTSIAYVNDSTFINASDKVVSSNQYGNLFVKDSAYSDAATFKTAMNGVMLVYELDTPEEYIVDVHKDLTRRIINAHIDLKYNYYKGGTEEVLSSDSNSVSPIIKLDYNGVELTDQEFTLRKTGNDLVNDNNVCLVENIKGNSLAWNQLMDLTSVGGDTVNGVTRTVNGNVINFSGTNLSAGVSLCKFPLSTISGHKYMLYANVTGTSHSGISIVFSNGTDTVGGNDYRGLKKYCFFLTSTTTTSSDMTRIVDYYSNDAVDFKLTLNILDLTLIYGSGNEPSTAAAFEADYQRWFGRPLAYEPYDAGSIRDCKMQQIVSRGFNQWNEEWKLGAINSITGTYISSSDQISNKNDIPVVPNTTYYIKNPYPIIVFCFNEDKTIYQRLKFGAGNSTFDVPSFGTYVRFCTYNQTVTTYNHDICINISDPNKNGTYEAYKESDLYLDVTQLKGKVNGQGDDVTMFPTGLHSAGSVHDEINLATGTAIQRVGYVDLGTLTWLVSGTYTAFYASLPTGVPVVTDGISMLCSRYVYTGSTMDLTRRDKTLSSWQTARRIYIKDDSYSDATTFKTAMNGVMLYYELETPIEYQLDVHDVQQVYVGNDLVWEKPVSA